MIWVGSGEWALPRWALAVGVALAPACSQQTPQGPGGSSEGGSDHGGSETAGSGGVTDDGNSGAPITTSDDADGSGGSTGGVPEDPFPTDALETWVWFPDDAIVCADGSTAGIGLNLTDQTDVLFIYLQGGGGCWDDETCNGLLPQAVNLDGFDEMAFDLYRLAVLEGGAFARGNAMNPFRDANFAFIPYCTGDTHLGDAIVEHRPGKLTHHVGHANMERILPKVAAKFVGAQRVWLTGTSAGGFGAVGHWGLAQDLFGEIPVDLIDDAGAPFPPPFLAEDREQLWRDVWNLWYPPDCIGCADDFHAVIPHFAALYPDRRFALLQFLFDPIAAQFFELSVVAPDEMRQASYALASEVLDPLPNASYFYVASSEHGMLDAIAAPWYATGGVQLREWLQQMADGDPQWQSLSD